MKEKLPHVQEFQQSCNEHLEDNKMMRFAEEYKAETFNDGSILFWHQLKYMS